MVCVGDAGFLGAGVGSRTDWEEAVFITRFTSSENIGKAGLPHSTLSQDDDARVGVLRLRVRSTNKVQPKKKQPYGTSRLPHGD